MDEDYYSAMNVYDDEFEDGFAEQGSLANVYSRMQRMHQRERGQIGKNGSGWIHGDDDVSNSGE